MSFFFVADSGLGFRVLFFAGAVYRVVFGLFFRVFNIRYSVVHYTRGTYFMGGCGDQEILRDMVGDSFNRSLETRRGVHLFPLSVASRIPHAQVLLALGRLGEYAVIACRGQRAHRQFPTIHSTSSPPPEKCIRDLGPQRATKLRLFVCERGGNFAV